MQTYMKAIMYELCHPDVQVEIVLFNGYKGVRNSQKIIS